MSDPAWPPPSSADPPEQHDNIQQKRRVDIIGRSMVVLALLGVVICRYLIGVRSDALYVQHANREGAINRRRWDKLNPGWKKTYKEGPPRKLTEPEKIISNTNSFFAH